jgi:hypothetical protein
MSASITADFSQWVTFLAPESHAIKHHPMTATHSAQLYRQAKESTSDNRPSFMESCCIFCYICVV